MSTSLNTKTPLSYQDWSNVQGNFVDISQKNYLGYLTSWYNTNNVSAFNTTVKKTKKEQYIQLIKDLTFLFNADERDLFLSQVDYTKDEDLIYIIPYLAQKLKEITQVLSSKREELKNSKIKDTLIGSNIGLERILYEYLLKNFTKKDYSYTKVPISPLANFYPQLSSINKDFFIEIEDLYDKTNYYDSDPTIDINQYLNIADLMETEPFSDLTQDELNALVSTRFLPRVANTPLSNVFNQYLTSIASTSSLSLSSYYSNQLQNHLYTNEKYLGETVYALTAIRTGENNIPDYSLNLNFTQGNNWFYWPSSDKVINDSQIGNVFVPISINESNLLLNRTVSGSSYENADLFFTDKNGIVEGAWLQGSRTVQSSAVVSIGLEPKEIRSFLFPFVGFNIDEKTLGFKSYSLNDSQYSLYKLLDPTIKTSILNSYYNNTLPISASFDIYLNQTNLIDAGAYAAKFSDEADTVTVRLTSTILPVYQDNFNGKTKQAFLYKFDQTDILISDDVNDIYWPIQTYKIDSGLNIPLTVNNETCLSVKLGELNATKSMLGAVAGTNFSTADIIYKLTDQAGSDTTEAAWFASNSLQSLNFTKNSIPVYSTSAIDCSQYIDGPIQSSLSTLISANEKISFVWMDVDTLADDVFNFKPHAAGCPFGETFPHDFYKNQDYHNINALNDSDSFPLNKNNCTCRSVNYSPIGHEGTFVTDYNGMADYLFADPFGIGVDFTLGTWKDTRRLDVFHSPQFSFYQLDGSYDKEVGFGTGTWKTGVSAQPMVLKTGRRYTYYRTPLRNTSNTNAVAPYLIVNYPYNNLTVDCPVNNSNLVDLTLIIDNSPNQATNFSKIKSIAKDFCSTTLNKNVDVLISVLSFTDYGVVVNYLTNDELALTTYIEELTISNSQKDLYDVLNLAYGVLYESEPENINCNYADLCGNLNGEIVNRVQNAISLNCPRENSQKSILIFSDGVELTNINSAVPYAQSLKDIGVQIMAMDIGSYSVTNTVMEEIATTNFYYNLESYLNQNDGNINNFIENISIRLLGCFPLIPTWCKAIKDENGNWIETYEPSDMILNAGDYLTYIHKFNCTYTTPIGNFVVPSLSFTINVKLDGWDYSTQTFSTTAIGTEYGAKPFWAVSYVEPSLANSFNKETITFGGKIRFLDNYVPVQQPEISDIVLTNNCYVEYNNRGNQKINWNEPIQFNLNLTDQIWNKLIINKDVYSLAFLLNSNNPIDLYVTNSYEPSDITLESYNTFKPAKYNLYLRNQPFTYNENLYYLNRCESSFVSLLTGVAIQATEYYSNLTNRHYPTIASICFPSYMVTKKSIGEYLLPDKLGCSYYDGKGYTMDLDLNSLTYLDSISAERMFLDLNKYSSRNRGLTKNDQLTPVKIVDIDNRWLIEPYSSGELAGVVRQTVNTQKLVPYQTNFEINPNNEIGLCFQVDNFQFWNPLDFNVWTDEQNFPLTFRKELILDSYYKRTQSLLTNKGILDNWRTDIFGNNYGLFKA